MTLTVRLDAEEAALVAQHVERMAKQAPAGGRISTAYAIRNLIRRGATEAARTR